MKIGTGMQADRLLVVEDDLRLLELIARFLTRKGIKVDQAANGREALERLSSQRYDMVFTDLHIPVMDGLSLLEWIKERHPFTKVVVMSGDDTPDNIILAMRAGAIDYILKPFRLAELLEVAERCQRRIEPANQASMVSLVRQLIEDLRGDLLSLAMMTRLLEKGYYGRLETVVAEQVRMSEEKMQAMIVMVEDYGEIAVLLGQGRALPEEELDLKQDVIRPILNEMTLELARKEIKVSIDSLQETIDKAMIKGNRVLLRNAFRVLFRAVLRHCKEEGAISFGISYNGRRFMVNVINGCHGLPEKQRQCLFNDHLFPAEEAGEPEEEDGLGAGLFLARNIVRQHGGELWYEARDSDSQFILTLPANC